MFIIIILFFVLLVGYYLIEVCLGVRMESKHIKIEIERTDGEEKLYWQRQLKKLYISAIPVVSWFVKRK